MMDKNIAISLNEDLTTLTEEIMEGGIVTGYFYVFAMRDKDGQEFFIANNNYTEPVNLLGMTILELDLLKKNINSDMEIGKSSSEMKLIPNLPPQKKKDT